MVQQQYHDLEKTILSPGGILPFHEREFLQNVWAYNDSLYHSNPDYSQRPFAFMMGLCRLQHQWNIVITQDQVVYSVSPDASGILLRNKEQVLEDLSNAQKNYIQSKKDYALKKRCDVRFLDALVGLFVVESVSETLPWLKGRLKSDYWSILTLKKELRDFELQRQRVLHSDR